MSREVPGPDAPVLAALADERLSLKAAREHGLVRFHGAPERVEQVHGCSNESRRRKE